VRAYLGVDNGVTGSLGFVGDGLTRWLPMPVRKELSYTKSKKFITRVDVEKLRLEIAVHKGRDILALIERPMVNPGRFTATLSAMRCLEATLIVLEDLKVSYQYVDSREWQKVMLPSGLQGDELKKASLEVGRRLWPSINFKPDADAMLMARWAQVRNL